MTSQNSHHLPHPKYRPDIDGLRAIAVLAVVIFHAFPNLLKGGFIGVDIFFVISGFLISTIILSGLEKDSFSFIEFYSRRIKRIFPALILVLTASFVFGWFALLADEYKQLGNHIVGGAGFVSNFFLWKESGYFDNAAETKPLLHLWSLGIEEQFYIVWPLLLWFAWKQRLNRLTITLIIFSISFFLNINTVETDATAAFYSPQTRFWELLIGSILAYITLSQSVSQSVSQKVKQTFDGFLDIYIGLIVYAQAPEINGGTRRNLQSLLGAVLIVVGILIINKQKFFPDWWALLPTIGAVLIISAGMKAWFNRVVLSNRLFVWFGLISFPLYLWHWPLLSFARIIESEKPTQGIRFSAIVVAIVLAWLTYKFIEKPMRFDNHSKEKTIFLLILMVAVGCTGYFISKKEGLPFRIAANPQIKNIGDIGHEEFHQYPYQKFHLCTPISLQKEALIWNKSIRCFQSKNSDLKDIALIGDSHAEHLFIGLAEGLIDKNIVYYTKGSLPYIGNKEYDNIFNYVINDEDIKTVIISAAWLGRIREIPQGSDFKNELDKTVKTLVNANKKVYLVEDVPKFSFDPKKCQYARKFSSDNFCIEDKKSYYNKGNVFSSLESVAKDNKNTKYLKVADYFCDNTVCKMAEDGVLFYRDFNHLNINGSIYLGRKIIRDNPDIAN